MFVVVGLGGNALLRRGEVADEVRLGARLDTVAHVLADIASHGGLVVTHGNGPQVGQAALDHPDTGLDILDAETEGALGHVIELALRNHRPDRPVATILTQVLVDRDDPAFAKPTKPVGPVYDEATAQRLAQERGWSVARDGSHWRRVVASPEPQQVLPLAAVAALRDAGLIVVCGGGGGIPVARFPDGSLRGVDAVIDKDRTSALLAAKLNADALLLLCDVDGVQTDFGTPRARTLHKVSTTYLQAMALPAGSMGAKVEAACAFVNATGRVAGIGRLEDASDVLLGRAGTIVSAGEVETRWWP